jgi:hypothetical protein
MMYHTRDYWVSGFHLSPGVIKNTTFLKLDLYSEMMGGSDSVRYVRKNKPQKLGLVIEVNFL